MHLASVTLISFCVTCVLVLLNTASSNVSAAELHSDSTSIVMQGDSIEYFATAPGKTLSIGDIQQLGDERWKKSAQSVPNFGYTSDSYWFRIHLLAANREQAGRYFFQVDYSVLDRVHFFVFSNGKLVSEQLSGDTYPFDSRLVKTNHFAHPIDLYPKQEVTLYINISSEGTVQFPAKILKEHDYLESRLLFYVAQGGFFGIVAIMLFYNLFLFFAFKAKEYLYYVFYGASVLLLLATKHGFSYQYLWPDSPWWNSKAIPLSIGLCSLFLLLFTYSFINVRQHSRQLPKAYVSLCLAMCMLGICSFLLPYGLAIKVSAIGAVLAIILCIISSVIALSNNDPSVKQYLVAWSAMLGGAVVLILTMFGLVPITALTQHAWQIGSGLEIVILSFALATKIRGVNLNIAKERKQRFEMQSLALKNEKEARKAKEEALELQVSISSRLESQVKDRTFALEEAMTGLQQANEKLEMLAKRDGLTNLWNRRHFNETILIEWRRCKRDNVPLSLIMMDIDHFKSFNDSYGHTTGDECLKFVADLLRHCCRRPADSASRFGGEEFAILLPNTHKDGALILAEKIRKEIDSQPFISDGQKLKVSVSVGVATFCSELEVERTEMLINAADAALYQAKRNGRNQVICA